MASAPFTKDKMLEQSEFGNDIYKALYFKYPKVNGEPIYTQVPDDHVSGFVIDIYPSDPANNSTFVQNLLATHQLKPFVKVTVKLRENRIIIAPRGRETVTLSYDHYAKNPLTVADMVVEFLPRKLTPELEKEAKSFKEVA